MYCVDLLILSILSFESHEMVGYFLSYDEMKFDVEIYSCSIHEYCCVLMEIDDGFVFAMLG